MAVNPMKMIVASLVALAVYSSPAAEVSTCTKPSEKAALSIMFFVTRGGHGDSWHGDLTPEGNLYLKAYTMSGSGSAMGHFRASPEQLRSMRNAMEKNDFFALPKEIQPARLQLHAPMAVIEVRDGSGLCRIALYDPPVLVSDPRAARFRAVWNEIWGMVPVRPTWEIQGLTR